LCLDAKNYVPGTEKLSGFEQTPWLLGSYVDEKETFASKKYKIATNLGVQDKSVFGFL